MKASVFLCSCLLVLKASSAALTASMPCNILAIEFSLKANNASAQVLIKQVLIKQQDEAEAANQKHKAQFDKVNAWGLQVDTLKHDMKEGIVHVGRLVRTGQNPETSPEIQATIDELNMLGVKFKEVRI